MSNKTLRLRPAFDYRAHIDSAMLVRALIGILGLLALLLIDMEPVLKISVGLISYVIVG
ncbi:MAG TPA: hypothetical protein GXZ89_02570, partial [Fastidiosipila sp.]|nr:hypothetical protein [Fastidiosipila sp.]